MYWSRQHVEELQRIFLGSGAGFIDGDAILDGTLGTDKLLATAGGIWNSSHAYPIGTAQIIQLPNVWASSGGVITATNELVAPSFAGWGIVTFAGRIMETDAGGTRITLQENPGSGYYDRMGWSGGIPVDPNLSLLIPMAANARYRMTITNTKVQTLGFGLFTLGMIGQAAEPP